MFVSMDGSGSGADITHAGVGSKRYRAAFKGPGGHSYGAFGLVSPAFAMGNAMDKLGRMQVPASPKTTFNVGVIGGGTSVNSIPFESWMEIDLRSESAAELEKLSETMMGLLNQAVAEENKARSTRQGAISLDLKLVGDRPTGETPRESRIVQTAAAAVRAAGLTPAFGISSTDSNVPFSLGIPAITIDSGGDGGRAHALDEWIDVEKSASLRGMRIALALILALAGG
jgi:di/tripeptidase